MENETGLKSKEIPEKKEDSCGCGCMGLNQEKKNPQN